MCVGASYILFPSQTINQKNKWISHTKGSRLGREVLLVVPVYPFSITQKKKKKRHRFVSLNKKFESGYVEMNMIAFNQCVCDEFSLTLGDYQFFFFLGDNTFVKYKKKAQTKYNKTDYNFFFIIKNLKKNLLRVS